MDSNQFQILIAFLFYVVHVSMGFTFEDRFRGVFLLMAGGCLIYLATLLPLSPVFVLPFCVPVGLIMIIYSVYILYVKDKAKGSVEEEKT